MHLPISIKRYAHKKMQIIIGLGNAEDRQAVPQVQDKHLRTSFRQQESWLKTIISYVHTDYTII